ncbi:hypothetical protein AAFF_G00354370 [Aldrovandia affinis]|uniref:Uncharacterized protein n=1 Tax=Aldrovandia affinis TaxID=143900 RepID=A0AAD7SIE8_9TELE|nr:hypothetical protein AAFF_G00354370 [Aldrovandia affinis]
MSGGPTVRRQCQFVPETALSEDECKEAISLMKHSADEDIVKNKMKLTFDYRRNMILDPQQSCNILFEFPRFKDVKGLVEQDFVLMFGEGVSGKLLEKWPTAYKKKIIQECRKLPSTSELEELLLTADPPEDSTERDADFGWDSDLSSVFLLLHLIPPSAQGRRKPGKVSASQAEKHLVVFKKSGTSIQEHLDAITTSSQPYLLAVGARKNAVHQFFIVLDKNAIPCRSTSCLGAFDELFKAHFVFGTSYNPMLRNMYTFIQTTVYNIDVGKVKESPRVAEVRIAQPVSIFLFIHIALQHVCSPLCITSVSSGLPGTAAFPGQVPPLVAVVANGVHKTAVGSHVVSPASETNYRRCGPRLDFVNGPLHSRLLQLSYIFSCHFH